MKYSKKIVRENIFTKKRSTVDVDKYTSSIFNPAIAAFSKNNMITFSNLSFINDFGCKFSGSFSLIYRVNDYVKFSYHRNYAEVLKSIVEAYLQDLFSKVKYYDKFEFNSTKIKAELNIIVDNYIEGISIIDIPDINIENHYNMAIEDDDVIGKDSIYEEKEIDYDVLNKYSNTGKFVLSTEFITSFSSTSRANIKRSEENKKYLSSDEFAVIGKNGILESGYHFMNIPLRNRVFYNDNVFVTASMIVNKNDLKNGVYDYLVEAKLIYQVIDPVKYVEASKKYSFSDYLNKSFYNFLINYDKIYGIQSLKPIINQSEVLTMFKYNNEEYSLKLEEFGIRIDAICIVTKERTNGTSLVRK